MSDRLTMTVSEAAAALGVGRNTVYGMIRDGSFPHVRVGRLILVPRVGLTRWLDAQTDLGVSEGSAHGHGR